MEICFRDFLYFGSIEVVFESRYRRAVQLSSADTGKFKKSGNRNMDILMMRVYEIEAKGQNKKNLQNFLHFLPLYDILQT